MSFFDGLYQYEAVMLVAGAFMFLVSVVLLIIFAVTGKSMGGLLPFFGVAIVMIGFPAYKKIEITKDGVTLDKDIHELLKNPTDPVLREKISNEVAQLSQRPIQNPTVVTTVARAEVVLGDNVAAENNVNKALSNAPHFPAAVELKKRIELDKNLARLATQVEKDPNDQTSRAQLASLVRETSTMQIASPVTISNLARAHAVLGNEAQARENIDKVLKINPSFEPATELKQRMLMTVKPSAVMH